ncbi:MAG: DUF5711 family protein [Ruminococcus sp.]|nr:DUF5711 family protein [Ruminococcus sp.]
MAKAKAFQTDIRRARRKKKLKRFLRRLSIILLVLAAVFALYFTRSTWIPWFEDILDRTQTTTVNDGELEAGNFPISTSDSSTSNTKLVKFGDEFIIATDTHINFYKANGVRKNSIQHTFSDYEVKVGDGRVLVYGRGSSTLSVMNDKEILFEKELDGDIYFAEMSSDNSFAVVTSSEGYSSYLTVYDKNGEVIYKFANNARINAVDFKPSGLGCFVSAFEMKNGDMITNIYSLDFDEDEVVFKSDNIENTTVIKANKLSDGDIIAVCDDRVIRLDKSGKILGEIEYESDLIDFDASTEVVSIAIKNSIDSSKSKLLVIRSDNDALEFELDEEIKSVECDSRNTYVLTDSLLNLYSMSGTQIATAQVSSDYVDFIALDDEVLFLGYREINKIDYSY